MTRSRRPERPGPVAPAGILYVDVVGGRAQGTAAAPEALRGRPGARRAAHAAARRDGARPEAHRHEVRRPDIHHFVR